MGCRGEDEGKEGRLGGGGKVGWKCGRIGGGGEGGGVGAA